MPNINITVAAKIATNTTPGEVIVCGNSDYTVTFAFDSEWAAETERTARFVYYKDGLSLYQDVAFTGTTVAVPVLSNISYVLVGVYAGNLHTTTPAKVLCDRSILCGDPLEVLTPEEKAKLQAQIGDLSQLSTTAKSSLVAAINEAAQSGGLSAAQIAALDGMFKIVAYTADPTAAYAAFKAAFTQTDTGDDDTGGGDSGETEKTLTSISVVYSGGSVTAGTAVNDLTGIVVTAHYSDGSTATVTGYTLSGTIAEGSNTITVSYGGKTTTFTVTGTAESSGEDSGETVALRGFHLAAPPTAWSNVEGWTRATNAATGNNFFWYTGQAAQSGVVYFRTLVNSTTNIQYCLPQIFITADDDPLSDIANANLTKLEADDSYTTFMLNGVESTVFVNSDGSVSTSGEGAADAGYVRVSKFTIPEGHVGVLTFGNAIAGGTGNYQIRYREGWLTLFYDDPRANITVTEVAE